MEKIRIDRWCVQGCLGGLVEGRIYLLSFFFFNQLLLMHIHPYVRSNFKETDRRLCCFTAVIWSGECTHSCRPLIFVYD